jgi:internalin A
MTLHRIERLDLSGCHIDHPMEALWTKPSLREVILHEATLPGVPAEELSPNSSTSCLDRLRAYFADLQQGAVSITDVKLMILGNGRAGKTQICRRLTGLGYDPSVPSTHGIEIGKTQIIPAGEAEPVTLRIWDFGGQDIYHGTHTLFMRSRAVYMLVWTPATEDPGTPVEHNGMKFRNHPLGYWVDAVRQEGGDDSPVVIVQAQCDRPDQEASNLPLPEGALDGLRFVLKQPYSAMENRRRAALDEALGDAVAWLRRNQGIAHIGLGRAQVIARLEAMAEADERLPAHERRHRLLTQEEFLALCQAKGNVASPGHLLSFLHNAGIVFYRPGLFGDRIILDQRWALEAVYAVLHRDKSIARLRGQRGRFTRADLGGWLWNEQEHSIADQELFLSFMQQCGICFALRRG